MGYAVAVAFGSGLIHIQRLNPHPAFLLDSAQALEKGSCTQSKGYIRGKLLINVVINLYPKFLPC